MMVQDVERLFGTWVEFSQDKELVALLILLERELRRRGYRVSIELGRRQGDPGTPRPPSDVHQVGASIQAP